MLGCRHHLMQGGISRRTVGTFHDSVAARVAVPSRLTVGERVTLVGEGFILLTVAHASAAGGADADIRNRAHPVIPLAEISITLWH